MYLCTERKAHHIIAEREDQTRERLQTHQEPTDTSKQPIRTRYLGQVTGYQPIRDQYVLIRSVPETHFNPITLPALALPFLIQKPHTQGNTHTLREELLFAAQLGVQLHYSQDLLRQSSAQSPPPRTERHCPGRLGVGLGRKDPVTMNHPDPRYQPVGEVVVRGCVRLFQEPTDTSKQPIRTGYLGHVTGYQPIRPQGPVLSDSVGSCALSMLRGIEATNTHYNPITLLSLALPLIQNPHTHTRKHTLREELLCSVYLIVPQYRLVEKQIITNQNSLFRSRDWLSANQGSCTMYTVHMTGIRNRLPQKQIITNQNSLFRSRDWLSANQGPLNNQSEQPISHVTGYQPIRDQYFLIRSVPDSTFALSLFLSIFLYLSFSLPLSPSLSFSLSLYLSIHLYISLYLFLSIFLSLSLSRSICKEKCHLAIYGAFSNLPEIEQKRALDICYILGGVENARTRDLQRMSKRAPTYENGCPG
eukprot:sb/3464334/